MEKEGAPDRQLDCAPTRGNGLFFFFITSQNTSVALDTRPLCSVFATVSAFFSP